MKSLEETLKNVREDKTLSEGLRVFDVFTVCVSLYAFFYIIAAAWQKDMWLALKVAGILAVEFIILSLVRHIVHAPRPYEDFGLGHPSGKEKKTRHGAFPSRHVFCTALLGCVCFLFSGLFGAILLGLSALLAVDRVLLGFHYPRDVIWGFVTGLVGGVLAILVLHWI